MDVSVRSIPDLELALLRRGLDDLAAGCERCADCRRTPLIGEQVYSLASGAILCELCRSLQPEPPASSRRIHGPEFGHTMRLFDNRTAA